MKNNLPNTLSLSRLLLTAVLVLLILINQLSIFIIAALLLFFVSITDYFDGYFARRFNAVTPLGVFLDLTADKILVSSLLIAFIQINLVPAWIAIIIVAREFIVSGLRSIAGTKGKIISAGKLGKQKTFFTLAAMEGLLTAKALQSTSGFFMPTIFLSTDKIFSLANLLLFTADSLLLIAVLWTILSGIEYVIAALPFLRFTKKKAEVEPKKR